MSADDANAPVPDVEAALVELHERDDQAGFLQVLAAGEVVLPQAGPAPPGEGVRLPFVEREGTRYVPAFSSRRRLAASGMDVKRSVAMRGADLGARWPRDEELWLAIDPGSERGVALPPDAVRALPALRID